MAYKTLFFDADHTLFDFDRSELEAFRKLVEHLSYNGDFDSFFSVFKAYNRSLWASLEAGEIDKSIIPTERFRLLLKHFELSHNPETIGTRYLEFLGNENHLLPGALQLIETLAPFYEMAIVTNGIESVQKSRFLRSPLKPFFKQVIISEAIGVAKPNRDFFEYALRQCRVTDPTTVLVIGDSLTSDIKGGMNAGLDTCWFNPKGLTLPQGYTPTHIAYTYSDISAHLVQ